MKEKVLFSHLSLGVRFKYKKEDERVYVKIGVELEGASVALWDENEQVSNWVGQPVYSFSEDGKDRKVFVVY